jgi:4-hydroxybenzoate polyprenyltransferase
MVLIRFFELIRWRNLLILLFTQWFAYFFLNRNECFHFELPISLLLVNFSTISIAAAGYLINDYFDLKIDAVNKPGEIIVEKFISRRWALAWHSILNLAGIAAGYFLSRQFAIVNVLISVLLWLYSAHFKKTFLAGNILVAFLMALALPVIVFTGEPLKEKWILMYAIFAFFTGVIREIIKDIEDVEGDRQYNSRTIPIALGFYKSKILILILCLFTIAILTLACGYLYSKQYIFLASYLVLFTGFPLLYFLKKLKTLHSVKQFHWASNYFKLIMLSGIVSMTLRCIKW